MEPFKNLINPGTVTNAGRHLQRVWPGFDRRRFEQQAASGLDGLEFKARAMQLADALEATLPADFATACEVIEASLAQSDRLIVEVAAVGDEGAIAQTFARLARSPGLAPHASVAAAGRWRRCRRSTPRGAPGTSSWPGSGA